jgi:hypothetical protein
MGLQGWIARRPAEHLLGLRLITNRGVTRSDAEIGGRKHDVRRGLTEVVLQPRPMLIVVGHGRDQRDGRGRPGYVAGALPYLREISQGVAVRDDDEVPRLPVARRRSRRPASSIRSSCSRGIGSSRN